MTAWMCIGYDEKEERRGTEQGPGTGVLRLRWPPMTLQSARADTARWDMEMAPQTLDNLSRLVISAAGTAFENRKP